MLTPLYVAPSPDWSIARTVDAFAQHRQAALTRHADGSYTLAGDGAVYRATLFLLPGSATTFVFGVYRDGEGTRD